MSNVAEVQKHATDSNATTTPPAGDSKPLGFYFSKDIPGHVKEKALGTRSSSNNNRPIDGKAAMSRYFNEDKAKSDKQESSIEYSNDSEQHSQQQSTDELVTQQASADEQEASEVGLNALVDGGTDSRDQVHRKVLRGISKGIQDARALETGAGPHDESEQSADAGKAGGSSTGSLVIPLNSSTGQFKPSTQKPSLNTDDM